MLVSFKLRSIVIFFVITSILLTTLVFVIADDEGVSLPIIMYHGVLKDKDYSGRFVITPDELEQDFKYLCDNGYNAVFMSQVIDYVENGTPLPQKPVVITFDDGYYNNYLYAYPLAVKYNMKLVISIVGKYSEEYSETDEESAYYSHVTWDEINEMVKSGHVEIQNHSYDMHTISDKRNGSKKRLGETDEQYEDALSRDVLKAQDVVKYHTGLIPEVYTYPFGGVSKASKDILQRLGFKATLGCAEGVNKLSSENECLYNMKRYIRPHGKPVSDILD